MTSNDPPSKAESRYLPMLLLIVLASTGITLHLLHTRFGPFVSGDAVHYIAGARNLLSGEIYSMVTGSGELRPIVAFPPLFSSILALIGLTGIDPLDGARYLNASLYGANILLAAVLTYRHTGSTLASGFVGGLFLTSIAILSVHAAAMSEPLFIFLMLLTVLALERFADTGSDRYVLTAAVLAAASALTRYAGASVIGFGLLSIAALSKRDLWGRLRRMFLFGTVAVAPILYWMGRNAIISGTATNRSLSFLMTRTRLALSMGELSSWVLPETIERRLRILMFSALTVVVLLLIVRQIAAAWGMRKEGRRLHILPLLLVGFIGSYMIMLGLSMTFLDVTMKVIPRHFSPAIIATWMLVVGQAYIFLKSRAGSGFVLNSAAVLGAGFLIWNGAQMIEYVGDPGPVFGYMDARRLGSGTIDAVSKLEPDKVLITNEIEKVYILTGRHSYRVPVGEESYSRDPRADLSHQMQAYWERLANGAVLVLFDTYALHDSYPQTEDLIDGLSVLVDAEDGTLYFDPKSISD